MTGWRASGSRYQFSVALPQLHELVAAEMPRRVAAPVPSVPKTCVFETKPTITSGPGEGSPVASDAQRTPAAKTASPTELTQCLMDASQVWWFGNPLILCRLL